MIAAIARTAHNLSQFALWATTLYMLCIYLTNGTHKCWKDMLLVAQYA